LGRCDLKGANKNPASKVLRLTLETCYGHPVLVVETFVDAAQFCGTVYSANGWSELGQTDGWRQIRDGEESTQQAA
jgi:hypothetical protein